MEGGIAERMGRKQKGGGDKCDTERRVVRVRLFTIHRGGTIGGENDGWDGHGTGQSGG